jgi:hypothetical protein
MGDGSAATRLIPSKLANVRDFVNLECGVADTKLLLQCLADARGELAISASRGPSKVSRIAMPRLPPTG